ncbi:hypothetical protein BD626DRAFT_44018 [Schizophyllum amplum]|uniref:Uncharacterized protein n=1 Tax=Schizophyllum amplum TaxID=97359 RepID=A0A550CDT5_9AGAR|nr:hypothetical protein BD626DRAFT_44018 [Auriculariopsis ampla]
MPSPYQRTSEICHVAQAIAVVRCKPPNQSYADFILQLQAANLPLPTQFARCECRQQTVLLERSLVSLRDELRLEQIKNASLARSLTSTPQPMNLATPEDLQLLVQPVQDGAPDSTFSQSRADTLARQRPLALLSSVLSEIQEPDVLTSSTNESRLVENWISLEDVILAIEDGYIPEGDRRSLLLATALRSFDAMSEFLRDQSASNSALRSAGKLIGWIFPHALPHLLRRDRVDLDGVREQKENIAITSSAEHFVGSFLARILTPLVPTFAVATRLHLESLDGTKTVPLPPSQHPPDTRPYTLSVILSAVDICGATLRKCGASTSDLRRMMKAPLALAVLREILKLVQTPLEMDPPHILESLVRKETLWYLSALARKLLSSDRAICEEAATERLFTDEMAEVLTAVIAEARRQLHCPQTVSDTPNMDSTTYHLLLSVAEAFWMCFCDVDA